jgi:hypothetical protein
MRLSPNWLLRLIWHFCSFLDGSGGRPNHPRTESVILAVNRRSIVLAGLAAGGDAYYSPAQVQKLFFLVDREAAQAVEGPHFSFQPFDYGPFDKAVYDELDGLRNEGLVSVDHNGWYRVYSLTPAGLKEGQAELAKLARPAAAFLQNASRWVRSLGFRSLVSAIYTKYPDMKANSIFRE